MNPTAVLALITDLYSQVTALTQENQELREALAEAGAPAATDPRA